MSTEMVTICCPGHAPTLAEVQEHYGLRDSEVDKSFGVIEVDSQKHLYTILVDSKAAPKIRSDDWQVEGAFINPAIAPFGPPQ